MTAYLDGEGWIRIYWNSNGNYIDLHCEEWSYSKSDPSAFVIDTPNRGHFGFSLNSEKVSIKLKNVWVDTEAKWNILKLRLEEAEDTGDAKVRIQISSTPTYELFNGATGKDVMPILIKNKKGMKKVYGGDTTFYIIGGITLIQMGVLE